MFARQVNTLGILWYSANLVVFLGCRGGLFGKQTSTQHTVSANPDLVHHLYIEPLINEMVRMSMIKKIHDTMIQRQLDINSNKNAIHRFGITKTRIIYDQLRLPINKAIGVV